MTASKECWPCKGSGDDPSTGGSCVKCGGSGQITRPIGLRFGEWLVGKHASEDNPQRRGMFVREGNCRGGMNAGPFVEMTDGYGGFWTYPPEAVEREVMHESTPPERLPIDISDACHGKRLDHYLNQYGGKSDGTLARMASREQAYGLAHNAATAEMMDEIHMMLRIILTEGKR